MFSFRVGMLLGLGVWARANSGLSQTDRKVSWSIGSEASTLDGGALKGPVTFTWTFNRPVKHGRYLDGTPWVLWEQGLELLAVLRSMKTESLPDHGEGEVSPWIVDATCINLEKNNVPLDQRIGNTEGAAAYWNEGKEVWDGRKAYRAMLFNAIGVCNLVQQNMTGRFRPPLRMPP
jgi:hypothetical protein